MQQADELEARVKRVLADVCAVEPAQVVESARLSSYGLDSVRSVELIVALEQELGVELPDDEAALTVTVGDLLARLRARVG